jgi:BirA family biotin operon repressor/biotin-[acetyl-CoA-carboxylase] ligase
MAAFSIEDEQQHNTSPRLHFVHRTEPVASTQEEVRRLLDEFANDDDEHEVSKGHQCLAVLANVQTAGRGTQGRTWKAAPGNLYLTVAIPIQTIPVTMTLLPLQIGVVIAQRVAALMDSCRSSSSEEERPVTTVKWPNDVLVNGRKLAGCLIENHTTKPSQKTWFLVGIGINVANSPSLTGLPGKHVRGATCIRDWCSDDAVELLRNDDESWTTTSTILGLDIANALADWTLGEDESNNTQDRTANNQLVIDAWKSWVNFGKVYELRGNVVDEDQGGFEGEKVITVGVQPDGQLLVRGENGRVRSLNADYLF